MNLSKCYKLESLPSLPDGLKSLSLASFHVLKSLPPLPNGLKSLSIASCANVESLPPLPENLKVLSISGNKSIKLEHFPGGLESLTVDMRPYEDGSFPVLPYHLSSFSAVNGTVVPPLPPLLSSLSLEYFLEMSCDKLPDGLKKLYLHDCPFSPLMEMLPDDLKELNLKNLNAAPDTVIDSLLPKGLNDLTLFFCKDINPPTKLPAGLSSISLLTPKDNPISWGIQPHDLPKDIDICINGYVKINPEVLTREDITFSHLPHGEASAFQSGDVVYGIGKHRLRAIELITSVYDSSKKILLFKNTLTDAVWSGLNGRVLSEDKVIAQELNDAQRGLSFKDFLLRHQKYDITDSKFSSLSSKELWMKTSKAGLEFQTRVRDRPVIFLADGLVDAIDDIATKQGEYGNAITAHELRWIYRNRHDEQVKQNVKFFLNGKAISHEDVFSMPGWEKYIPKM
ncbi:type III secretion system protein [Edwardsiella ictaluri]